MLLGDDRRDSLHHVRVLVNDVGRFLLVGLQIEPLPPGPGPDLDRFPTAPTDRLLIARLVRGRRFPIEELVLLLSQLPEQGGGERDAIGPGQASRRASQFCQGWHDIWKIADVIADAAGLYPAGPAH